MFYKVPHKHTILVIVLQNCTLIKIFNATCNIRTIESISVVCYLFYSTGLYFSQCCFATMFPWWKHSIIIIIRNIKVDILYQLVGFGKYWQVVGFGKYFNQNSLLRSREIFIFASIQSTIVLPQNTWVNIHA